MSYLKAKASLISEAIKKGFINTGDRNKICRLDVGVTEEQGKRVYEFVAKSGWVEASVGEKYDMNEGRDKPLEPVTD